MKSARLLVFLPLIAIFACASAHKNVSVEQDMIPGWKLGYEHLDILDAALELEKDVKEYALHSVEDPMLTASIIVRNWVFLWNGAEYEIVKSDYLTKAVWKDADPVYYSVLNYAIYSEDGGFVMELERVDSSEGKNQFLARASGDGIVVDIFNAGQITTKAYEKLPARYGCPDSKIRSLTHDEEFSYCAFGVEFTGIVLFKNKVTRENDVLKIMSRQYQGQMRGPKTEIHLNQEREIIYMASEGLEFKQCDVDTALAERVK